MTLKNYLIFMGSTTAILWGLFIFVMNFINPDTTNWLGFVLFYLSLFLALSGTIAIIGSFIRFKMLKHELVFNSVKIAFRQSFLFAVLIATVLFLLSQSLFNWLNFGLIIIILSLIEYLIISYYSPKL